MISRVLLLAAVILSAPARADWRSKDPDCIIDRDGLCSPASHVFFPLDARFKDLMDQYHVFRQHQTDEETLRKKALANPQSMLALDDWHKKQAGLRDEQTQINIKAGELLRDIAAAYRLPIDFMKDEDITAGAFRGQTARFDPKFAFEDFYVSKRKASDGRELTWARDYRNSRASATTLPTGEVLVRMKAFETAAGLQGDAVGYLASIVYHESIHFKEVFKSPKVKRERTELQAYSAVVKYQEDIFGLPESIRQFNKSQVEEFKAAIKRDQDAKHRYAFGGSLPHWPGSAPDLLTLWHPDDKHWDALADKALELEAPLDSINTARTNLRRRINYQKTVRGDYERRVAREREAIFGKPQPPDPPTRDDDSSGGSGPNSCPGTLPCVPTPVLRPRYPSVPAPAVPAQTPVPAVPAVPGAAAPPADRRRSAELALVEISNRVCSGSDALSQEDFDALWARVYNAPITAESRDRYGLRGCAWTIYGDLSGYSQADDLSRLSVDWLYKRVGEVQTPVSATDEVPDAPRPPDRPRCRWAGDWCK